MKKKTLWKLHHWLGLYTGIILIVLSISGAIAVFKQEIDKTLNPSLYKITKSEGEQWHTLQEVYEYFKPTQDSLFRLKHKALNIRVPEDKYSPYIFNYVYKAGGIKKVLQNEQREYFINPYSLKTTYRDRQKTFTHYIRSFHVHLYEFYLGRFITGFFGVALFLSIITGFLIYGNFMKKRSFGSIRTEKPRQKWADIHKLVGILALFFNLIISITGASLGLEKLVSKPDKKAVLAEKKEPYIEPDYVKVLQVTKENFKELIPNQIVNENSKITVYGIILGQIYQREGGNRIVISKKNYQVIEKRDIAKMAVKTKLYYAQEGLHYGDFGGVWIKILYTFFGLITGVLSIIGYYLYYKRNTKLSSKKVRSKMIKYTIIISGYMVLLYILTAIFNGGFTYAVVTLSFYIILSIIILRILGLFFIKKIRLLISK